MKGDDAQQRKDRAEKMRRRIHRPAPGSSGPTPADAEPPDEESLKDRIERRMRELDEAERKDHPPSPDDDDAP
ncbi:hypothetical protein [Streptomyces sp. NBC_01244]|uniref:hypothetical protein n=1 Tax=Streptomyces sp. NBC_01244 TaxID=2903797 RepID=UPI002E103267|nr:hypothetical protein OG247_37075 [Streptomyces sp. NBC_01244]